MRLPTGARIGPYEVTGALGAGGMGEVYRAHDSTLNRDVALKILPEALAADPERLARFRREAQVLASLNHPTIAALYGVEDSPNGQALVMELVPGRTLAEILATDGPLPPDEAVHVAAQIADALEAAHEAGVIHRDLKPANIKRRDDDVVKVLDFGLAKGLATADEANAASSPTMLSPAVTHRGVILGTAGYMAPEQARGRAADKRADIWAFGVVLYEMLVGRPLFGGDTVTETIASVIKDPLRLDALPPATPPALRRLLARCLERDPKLRLRDIGEARIALRSALDPSGADAATGPATASPGGKPRIVTRVAVAAASLVLAGLAALTAWHAKPVAPLPVRRLDLPAVITAAKALALSPDGTHVAYIADGRLYVRALDAREPADLGTVTPATRVVFWAPDSRSIGYDGDLTLHTIPIGGGVPFTVCRIPTSGQIVTGAWRADDTIVMAVSRDGLYQVSAKGGTPALQVAIDPNTEIDFHAIALLPDSRVVVTTRVRGQDGDYRADLIDGTRRTPLTDDLDIASIRFVAPDRFLFLRARTNPGVWVAPFDGRTLDVAKAALVEPGATGFDAASDGTIVSVLPAKERRDLVWIDPQNAQPAAWTPVPGIVFQPANGTVALSPDGRRAVLKFRTPDFKEDVVVRDLVTGADTHIPFPDAPTREARGAIVTWTPSGRLLYTAGGTEASKIFDWPADGSRNGRPLVAGITAHISSDGRQMIFLVDERGKSRLRRAPLAPDGSVGAIEPVFPADDEPMVRSFDLSPDGQLLAIASTQPNTQQLNITVMTYPELRERGQVTSNGGTQPRFSRDGHELFFASGARTAAGLSRGELRVVTVKAAPLTIGAPRTILADGPKDDRGVRISGFDVAPDGRLIMSRAAPLAPGDEARIVLLQNWPAAIRK